MWLLRSHPRPQYLNMFSSQQVFRSKHDKESLALLRTKQSLRRKLIKALETRVLRSKLVCSHTFPKTGSDNWDLLFEKVCVQTRSLNHKVTSTVTVKLCYNFSFSRAFSKPKTQLGGLTAPPDPQLNFSRLPTFISNLFFFSCPARSHPLGSLFIIFYTKYMSCHNTLLGRWRISVSILLCRLTCSRCRRETKCKWLRNFN